MQYVLGDAARTDEWHVFDLPDQYILGPDRYETYVRSSACLRFDLKVWCDDNLGDYDVEYRHVAYHDGSLGHGVFRIILTTHRDAIAFKLAWL